MLKNKTDNNENDFKLTEKYYLCGKSNELKKEILKVLIRINSIKKMI